MAMRAEFSGGVAVTEARDGEKANKDCSDESNTDYGGNALDRSNQTFHLTCLNPKWLKVNDCTRLDNVTT